MPRNARKKRAEKKEKYVQNKLDVLAKNTIRNIRLR